MQKFLQLLLMVKLFLRLHPYNLPKSHLFQELDECLFFHW